MKIVVFNLRYGANLGDQLIAQCVAAELSKAEPSFAIVTEDLGGRDAPPTGTRHRGLRMAALFILQALPKPARQWVAGKLLERLVRARLEPRWHAVLSDADAVVIGGGGIFADSDLNFPMKISAAIRMATDRQLPLAIHAVGVSPGWSPRGRRLFDEALRRAKLCSLTMRDDSAIAMWNAELRNDSLRPTGVAPDPALTLTHHLSIESADPGRPQTIGICLTSPAALRYHGVSLAGARAIEQWYLSVAAELSQRGFRVVGFDTGVTEDVHFAMQLANAFAQATNSKGHIAPSSDNATALVTLISGFHGLISHRLHAIIAAYTLGIPGLALEWDPKMQGQMDMLGCGDRLLDAQRFDASGVADRIETIIAQGINLDRRDTLVQQAQAATLRLARCLRSAVPIHGQ